MDSFQGFNLLFQNHLQFQKKITRSFFIEQILTLNLSINVQPVIRIYFRKVLKKLICLFFDQRYVAYFQDMLFSIIGKKLTIIKNTEVLIIKKFTLFSKIFTNYWELLATHLCISLIFENFNLYFSNKYRLIFLKFILLNFILH